LGSRFVFTWTWSRPKLRCKAKYQHWSWLIWKNRQFQKMWSYQLVYQQLKPSLGAYLFWLVSIGLISLWKKFQSDKQNWWKSLNKGYSTKILMNNDQNRVSTVVKGKLTVSKTTSLENNQTWYGLVSTVETPRLSTNSFLPQAFLHF
jgi:hypothetical protein